MGMYEHKAKMAEVAAREATRTCDNCDKPATVRIKRVNSIDIVDIDGHFIRHVEGDQSLTNFVGERYCDECAEECLPEGWNVVSAG